MRDSEYVHRKAGSKHLEELTRTELRTDKQRSVLVKVILPNTVVTADDPLDELAALAESSGAEVVGRVTQKRRKIDAGYYIGKGKAKEVADICHATDAELVIFDNDLTPGQVRDLEEAIDLPVVDRTELILDIFAGRAQTQQARIQVELAQMEYALPRLKRMWTHLSRIVGGHGPGIGARGPGETQLETDRRLSRRRIQDLKRRLAALDRRRIREVRSRSEHFTICLVGYTNAGKSTLMNTLTDAGVLVKDQLFATLDTRTRKWNLGDGVEAMLSDTIGFVSDLPHHLVASFKATLEEAVHADLLLHVADIASHHAFEQIEAVEQVLESIGCGEKDTLVVLNKIDRLPDVSEVHLVASRVGDAIPISAATGKGLAELAEIITKRIAGDRIKATVAVDFRNGRLAHRLAQIGSSVEQTIVDNRLHVKMTVGRRQLDELLAKWPEATLVVDGS